MRSKDAQVPKRSNDAAIGLDIYAYLLDEKGRSSNMVLGPRTTRRVPTGIVVALENPGNWGIFIYARSGLSAQGITIANAPGVIDPDYRGELQILLHNGSAETHYITHGDRIAQLLVLPTLALNPVVVTELENTERGAKGFGSSGR